MPTHFKRICSVIDEFPPDINFKVSELHSSEASWISQVFEDLSLSQNSNTWFHISDGKRWQPVKPRWFRILLYLMEPSGEHSKSQRKDVMQNNSVGEVNKALPCRALVVESSISHWVWCGRGKNELLQQLSANHDCRTAITIILTLVSVMQRDYIAPQLGGTSQGSWLTCRFSYN